MRAHDPSQAATAAASSPLACPQSAPCLQMPSGGERGHGWFEGRACMWALSGGSGVLRENCILRGMDAGGRRDAEIGLNPNPGAPQNLILEHGIGKSSFLDLRPADKAREGVQSAACLQGPSSLNQTCCCGDWRGIPLRRK